jgi:hypothetical protein
MPQAPSPGVAPRNFNHTHGPAVMVTLVPNANSAMTAIPLTTLPAIAATSSAE